MDLPGFGPAGYLPKRLLALAALLTLLAGMAAGLARFGWFSQAWLAWLAAIHGPLMLCGFFGVLIGLERAAAMDRAWALLVPGLGVLGSALLLSGAPWRLAGAAFCASGLGLAGLHLAFYRRQKALHSGVMLAGAACWLAGNLGWTFSLQVFRAAPLWAAFLVLLIAGERLELSRFQKMPGWALPAFRAAVAAVLAGALAALADPGWSRRLLGCGLLALAAWLAAYDRGPRLGEPGPQGRFIRQALGLGYFWLGLAGLAALLKGVPPAGPGSDAFLHSIFLGYAFSMVLAHGLMIFPPLSGVRLAFHRGFTAALWALELSLALRVCGDFFLGWEARRWGGLLNAAAILLFLASVPLAALKAARSRAGEAR